MHKKRGIHRVKIGNFWQRFATGAEKSYFGDCTICKIDLQSVFLFEFIRILEVFQKNQKSVLRNRA